MKADMHKLDPHVSSHSFDTKTALKGINLQVKVKSGYTHTHTHTHAHKWTERRNLQKVQQQRDLSTRRLYEMEEGGNENASNE